MRKHKNAAMFGTKIHGDIIVSTMAIAHQNIRNYSNNHFIKEPKKYNHFKRKYTTNRDPLCWVFSASAMLVEKNCTNICDTNVVCSTLDVNSFKVLIE